MMRKYFQGEECVIWFYEGACLPTDSHTGYWMSAEHAMTEEYPV